ncbi:hypothetical protein TRAPUB_5397, partial [Trametes pubescens]
RDQRHIAQPSGHPYGAFTGFRRMAPAAPSSSASILAMSSSAISKSNAFTLDTIRPGVADFGRELNLWRITLPQSPGHE